MVIPIFLFVDKLKDELDRINALLARVDAYRERPKGSVVVREGKNGVTYSLRYAKKHASGTRSSQQIFIGDVFSEKLRKLKRDYYCFEIRRRLVHNQKVIERAIRDYLDYNSESINEALPKNIRNIPMSLPPKESVDSKSWEDMPYERLEREYENELYSMLGRRFRSKSEVIIANALEMSGIPYRHEERLNLMVGGQIAVTRYPDFTILTPSGEEIYWEHFGKLADERYSENVAEKIRLYAMNGITPGRNLIISVDSFDGGIDSRDVMKQIDFIKRYC